MPAEKISVMICCVTRLRPKMFKSWLESTRFLDCPENVDLEFVVVENNSDKTYGAIIAHETENSTDKRVFHYDLATKLGIASARNIAVKIALKAGADYIAFVDDDEIMRREWLTQMLSDCQTQNVLLIGGPVLPLMERNGLTRFETIVANGIAHRYYQVEKKNSIRMSKNKFNRIAVVTNNWLCHRSLFTEHGLSFREDLGLSGGEDTVFCKDARQKGIKTGWSTSGFLYEKIPSGRISLAYQYERSRTQALAHLRDKRRRYKGLNLWFNVLAIAATCLRLIVIIVALLPAMLATGGLSIVSSTRNFGWCHGRVSEIFGENSEFYKKVTGE